MTPPAWLFARPLFADRADAGRRLAGELPAGIGRDAVVVGLARGGVAVAAEVARALAAPLDVVAVRKIRHPYQPEYALGAVAPGDGVYLRSDDGLTEEQVRVATDAARRDAAELDRRLHARSPAIELEGRVAVLVDDGLATGSTMIAAVRWARARRAASVVAAVPVGARASTAELRRHADDVVCPHELDDFLAVGIWYDDFRQIGDEDVIALLDADRDRAPHGLTVNP